jgi:hypothetical protein
MNITFAKVTEYHETLEFQVTPCARFLYHWLLRNTRAGNPQEIELEDFIAFTARGRSRPYSLRHVWKALKELFNLGVVDVVKQYSWKIWKVIAYHPLVAETSRSEAKKPQTEAKKPYLQASNPDSVVPINREFREHTDSPPPLPVVVDEGTGQIEIAFDQLENGVRTTSKSLDSNLPSGLNITQELSNTVEPDQASQNSLEKVKEAIAPQKLHPHLQQFVLSTDIAVLENALLVVKEVRAKSHVKNPSGLLVDAIKGKWVPASPVKAVVDEFKAWYESAYSSGVIQRFTSSNSLVTGHGDGVMCVMRVGSDRWIPWLEVKRSHG